MHLNENRVKALRLDKGWTQQQLADACGVSMRTIQRIEKSGVASLDTTAALVAVFSVERQELLKVSGPPSPDEAQPTRQPPYAALIGAGIVGMVLGASATALLL